VKISAKKNFIVGHENITTFCCKSRVIKPSCLWLYGNPDQMRLLCRNRNVNLQGCQMQTLISRLYFLCALFVGGKEYKLETHLPKTIFRQMSTLFLSPMHCCQKHRRRLRGALFASSDNFIGFSDLCSNQLVVKSLPSERREEREFLWRRKLDQTAPNTSLVGRDGFVTVATQNTYQNNIFRCVIDIPSEKPKSHSLLNKSCSIT
jgi:hypothetical protein